MPGYFLTDAERLRLSSFPAEVVEADLVAFYTLTAEDLAVVRRGRRGDANRLGFALQLCTLRFLGFVPDELAKAPPAVVAALGAQLGVSPLGLSEYAERDQTRTDHLVEVVAALGFRSAGPDDQARLGDWLLDRALEHDKPTLLFQLAAEHLRSAKLLRPGVTVLERLVSTARERAEKETHCRLASLFTDERTATLDRLLVPEPTLGRTRLAWLSTGATATTPSAILDELSKLTFVRELGAAGWDLSALNPNRIKFLAQLARRSTNQALQRFAAERRYPALVAFLVESVAQLTDEVVDLFDRTLFGYHNRASRELDELKRATARTANEKVVLFSRLAHVLLDESIADAEVRSTIYREVSPDHLARAMAEADKLARPLDDSYFDFLATRYSHVRECAPAVVAALDWRATTAGGEIVRAVALLRQLNADHRRRVPDDAPLGFVPARWRPYVVAGSGQINRRYWELCLLSELRGALRSGDVWVAGSRRYANPETYLISPERWPSIRGETVALLGASASGRDRLEACEAEFTQRLTLLDRAIGASSAVRIENGELIISRLTAEELPEDNQRLHTLVAERLPKVDLAALLIEVDGWCGFTQHLTHAGGAAARTRDLLTHLYAAILAQACNFGLGTMADVADLSYQQLAWATEWHLREETLRTSTAAIANHQHRLPLAQAWGGGTLSSSDGQRFPVSVKSTTATALPRYFGLGRGLTFYTWTSDQFSQFGTKVISSTVRDATYVLDGLLDNETELAIVEHTTDTAGYTDLVFALFDLLGMQFAPRIRDLGDQRLYRVGAVDNFLHGSPFIKGTINRQLIIDRWDDLLRVAGSLKLGWVTASLLISRLQASPRQNALTKALQEYGRVAKTLFVLRYLESEEYRRRINRQLNKGEALHALRRFLFFANEGRIHRRHLDIQTNQASCLNLVTNAVITWNTVYIDAALRQLRAEGAHPADADAVAHLSPTMYAHINPYGKYRFDIEGVTPGQLRPLRQPSSRTS